MINFQCDFKHLTPTWFIAEFYKICDTYGIFIPEKYEPHNEKIGILHMRNQRRRSAVQ